jgi:hypothetical protein
MATFKLLLLLSGAPATVAQHAARGVPAAVTKASLGDLAVWARAHRNESMSPVLAVGGAREWGLSNTGWPLATLRGSLLRVGRFQHKVSFPLPPAPRPMRPSLCRRSPPPPHQTTSIGACAA